MRSTTTRLVKMLSANVSKNEMEMVPLFWEVVLNFVPIGKNTVEFTSGFTAQQSTFDSPVLYSDALPRTDIFLRTPNTYGFANLYLFPKSKFNTSINTVYTGPMTILHMGGAPEQPNDEFVTSRSFFEINARVAYSISTSQCKVKSSIIWWCKKHLEFLSKRF